MFLRAVVYCLPIPASVSKKLVCPSFKASSPFPLVHNQCIGSEYYFTLTTLMMNRVLDFEKVYMRLTDQIPFSEEGDGDDAGLGWWWYIWLFSDIGDDHDCGDGDVS